MAIRVTVKGPKAFDALEPPADEREKKSRDQIGPAVVMYRALKERLGQEEALRITGEVVNASGVIFMQRNIGKIDSATLTSLDDEGRRAFVESRSEKFFNATIAWDHVEPRRVGFTVHACVFPGLCAAVGVPELAPIFCAVDAAFFGGVEPNVELRRPETLAGGDPRCVFELEWRGED